MKQPSKNDGEYQQNRDEKKKSEFFVAKTDGHDHDRLMFSFSHSLANHLPRVLIIKGEDEYMRAEKASCSFTSLIAPSKNIQKKK